GPSPRQGDGAEVGALAEAEADRLLREARVGHLDLVGAAVLVQTPELEVAVGIAAGLGDGLPAALEHDAGALDAFGHTADVAGDAAADEGLIPPVEILVPDARLRPIFRV